MQSKQWNIISYDEILLLHMGMLNTLYMTRKDIYISSLSFRHRDTVTFLLNIVSELPPSPTAALLNFWHSDYA